MTTTKKTDGRGSAARTEARDSRGRFTLKTDQSGSKPTMNSSKAITGECKSEEKK